MGYIVSARDAEEEQTGPDVIYIQLAFSIFGIAEFHSYFFSSSVTLEIIISLFFFIVFLVLVLFFFFSGSSRSPISSYYSASRPQSTFLYLFLVLLFFFSLSLFCSVKDKSQMPTILNGRRAKAYTLRTQLRSTDKGSGNS